MNHWNNHILEDKVYVGDSVIDGYKLCWGHEGGIPFAIPSEGSKIKGEIWDIGDDTRCLDRLDRLEGHPNFYRRTPATTESGEDVEFYVYQGFHNRDNLLECPKNAHGQFIWEG